MRTSFKEAECAKEMTSKQSSSIVNKVLSVSGSDTRVLEELARKGKSLGAFDFPFFPLLLKAPAPAVVVDLMLK
ncbi:hypothetical protein YC2023_100797 [Brassica napus]